MVVFAGLIGVFECFLFAYCVRRKGGLGDFPQEKGFLIPKRRIRKLFFSFFRSRYFFKMLAFFAFPFGIYEGELLKK